MLGLVVGRSLFVILGCMEDSGWIIIGVGLICVFVSLWYICNKVYLMNKINFSLFFSMWGCDGYKM